MLDSPGRLIKPPESAYILTPSAVVLPSPINAELAPLAVRENPDAQYRFETTSTAPVAVNELVMARARRQTKLFTVSPTGILVMVPLPLPIKMLSAELGSVPPLQLFASLQDWPSPPPVQVLVMEIANNLATELVTLPRGIVGNNVVIARLRHGHIGKREREGICADQIGAIATPLQNRRWRSGDRDADGKIGSRHHHPALRLGEDRRSGLAAGGSPVQQC